MAVAGLALSIATWYAVSKFISALGGDPEGDVADRIGESRSRAALQQNLPLNRERQRLSSDQEVVGALEREEGDFQSEAREMALGRRVTGARDLLEQVSQRLGTTSEDLGQRLSPTRMGDHSSLSKAAFGRSAKQMGN